MKNFMQPIHRWSYSPPAVATFLLVACCGAWEPVFADDPMNQPLDSVGVTGYDTKLCNDKWNTCSEYDRSQFDTKYPGTSLDSISLYPLKESDEAYRSPKFREASEEELDGDDSPGDGEE